MDLVLVVTGTPPRVEFWHLGEQRLLRALEVGATVTALALAPDGGAVLLARQDGRLDLRDATGRRLQTFPGHVSLVKAVAFSLCGRYVISGSMGLGPDWPQRGEPGRGVVEPTLRLWDRASGGWSTTSVITASRSMISSSARTAGRW